MYTNDATPNYTSTLGTFTEATDVSYAPRTLASASWTTTPDPSGVGMIGVYSQVTFSFATTANIYGYYVTDTGAPPNLLWAERLASPPVSIAGTGGIIVIPPRVEFV